MDAERTLRSIGVAVAVLGASLVPGAGSPVRAEGAANLSSSNQEKATTLVLPKGAELMARVSLRDRALNQFEMGELQLETSSSEPVNDVTSGPQPQEKDPVLISQTNPQPVGRSASACAPHGSRYVDDPLAWNCEKPDPNAQPTPDKPLIWGREMGRPYGMWSPEKASASRSIRGFIALDQDRKAAPQGQTWQIGVIWGGEVLNQEQYGQPLGDLAVYYWDGQSVDESNKRIFGDVTSAQLSPDLKWSNWSIKADSGILNSYAFYRIPKGSGEEQPIRPGVFVFAFFGNTGDVLGQTAVRVQNQNGDYSKYLFTFPFAGVDGKPLKNMSSAVE